MKQPLVSIVLPLYNASAFLEQGLGVVSEQTYENWELIAVNDGSTDNTAEMFQDLSKDYQEKTKFITRENGGGFEARNTGLDHVSGEYIAFFDVDDTWTPEHLERCLQQLEEHKEVDWVFALNRIVDITQNKVLTENSFYDYSGNPHEVTKLNTLKKGELYILKDDRLIQTQALYGIRCGQQYSVIRKEVFDGYRFRASYRNEGADQVSVIRSLNRGFTFGYLNEVHGDYAIHENNASAGARGASMDKYLRLRRALIRGFRELIEEENLSSKDQRAIEKRIAGEYFWNIGYNIFWKNNDKKQALKAYKQALAITPFDIKMWKTFILAIIR